MAWRPADDEIELSFIRASGPGGQNINKVNSAVQLRFDVRASRLPETVKNRLLNLHDQRLSNDGVLVIKAQEHRSQDMNRNEALARLVALVEEARHPPKIRRATRPTRGSQQRRLAGKALRSGVKAGRGKVGTE
jgi:ribosome-associated protein